MATAQMSRTDTTTGTWESVFPNEQVTDVQSTLFVKKLLAVAISSITYLRALFPEAAYGNRCVEEVNLKILRDDSSWPDACRVIQWLRGCFDALEKKYLRGVLIGIYDDPEDPDTVIEQYTFKFAYGDGNGMDLYRNGVKLMSASSEETKKATIRLLRTIVILSQTFAPLPDNVYMTMKLVYYDEITPEDYDPPGFKQSGSDEFVFKEEPMNVKVGDVATNFHSFKLRVKTLHHELQTLTEDETQVVYTGDMNKVDPTGVLKESVVPSDTDVTMNDDLEEPSSIYPPQSEVSQSILDEKPNSYFNNMVPLDEAPGKTDEPSQQDITLSPSTEETKTLCPCGINEDDGLMILCAVCNCWQHATCFGILNQNEAPILHYCIDCSKNSKNSCTDRVLANIDDPIKVGEKCLWRRTLLACTEYSRVVPAALSKRLGVPVSMGSSLIQRLENEGFVKSGGKGKRYGKLVQKDEIRARGFDRYFKYDFQNEDVDLAQEASKMNLDGLEGLEETAPKHVGVRRKTSARIATNNSGLHFEISDSQVTSPKKRRKASISADPMCV